MEAVLSTPDRKARRNPHSPVLKHSIRLAGNKTSISLENQFWIACGRSRGARKSRSIR